MKSSDIYKYSWFANAAYVEWDPFNVADSNRILSALRTARLIPGSLSNIIFNESTRGEGRTIPSFYPGDGSGFAANVFANGEEKILAIRGTEPKSEQIYLDLLQADLIEIGIIGCGLSQATSMFNYIQRLRAPRSDHAVEQLHLRITEAPPPANTPSVANTLVKSVGTLLESKTIYYWFETSQDGKGEGVFAAGDKVSVTGHSLGGHLASLAVRLFPDLFTSAVTFNAANFDPQTANFTPAAFDQFIAGLTPNSPITPFIFDGYTNAQQQTEPLINQLFAAYLPQPPAPDFQQIGARIFNYVGEDSIPGDDADFVTGFGTGNAPAPRQAIRTEVNSHAMNQLMDSLSAYALLERLNPGLEAHAIARLFDAASNRAASSLELLVGALDGVLNGRAMNLETVVAGIFAYPEEEAAPGTFARRAAIHDRILTLEAQISATPGLTLQPLVDMPAEEIARRAVSSPAYRAALLALAPFVVDGADALYANRPELALENFSDPYRVARAGYLKSRIARNLDDTESGSFGELPVIYRDLSLNETLQVPPQDALPVTAIGPLSPLRDVTFGRAEDEVLVGAGKRDYLFGGGGRDHVTGATNEDVLDGGAGADVLEGGGDRDALWGGAGDDWLYGGSLDLIDDDAPDRLIGGAGFDHYRIAAGDTVVDHDGQVEVLVNGQLQTLDSHALHERFSAPELRILHATDASDLTYLYFPLLKTLQVAGIVLEDFMPGDLGITLQGTDEPLPDPLPRLGTNDHDSLGGTAARDEIRGLGGDDTLHGEGAADVLYGGDDRDRVYGDTGDDTLAGDGGRDMLSGGLDDDVIDGGAEADLLSGDAGNDILRGGSDDSPDVLLGGSGHDILLGGGGADLLIGSAQLAGAVLDWSVWRLPRPLGQVLTDPRGFELRGVQVVDFLALDAPRDPDADALYGEAGDDYLIGSAGDDALDGGADDDVIMGGDGADWIVGGSGVDHIRGGGGADRIDGGAGNDFIAGYGSGDEGLELDGDDAIDGGADDDELQGGPGNDSLRGGDGRDLLVGDDGNDVLEGGSGNDELLGRAGNDDLRGGAGNDVLWGEAGNDGLSGGDDDDVLLGGDDNDGLYGDGGADQLVGGAGQDALFGGAGSDILIGGDNNDVLMGEAGDDTLAGDGGNDRYIFGRGDGADRLSDAFGDNGLQLLRGLAPMVDNVRVDGAALLWRFNDSDSLRVENWQGPGALAALRYGDGRYLSRTHFLNPEAAGVVDELAVDASEVGSNGDDLIIIRGRHGVLSAGAGDDRYQLTAGAVVEISDTGGANTLEFAADTTLNGLTVERDGDRYLLRAGVGTVTVARGDIANFVFGDGLVLAADEFATRFALPIAPRVVNPASTQAAFIAEPFYYALPRAEFIDLNVDEALVFSAAGRGGALPAWLNFDPVAGTLSGIPSPADAGVVEVEIRATDKTGLSTVDTFAIDVMPSLAGNSVAMFKPETLTSDRGAWVTRFDTDGPAPFLVGVGDLNADGIDDVLDLTNEQIVFGRGGGFGLDYVAPAVNGANGFTFSGYAGDLDPTSRLNPVHYAPRRGDFNRDGIDDVEIGSRVLLGRASPFASLVDYAALPLGSAFEFAAPTGVLPTLVGADRSSFQTIGDFNGDGFVDFFGVHSDGRDRRGLVVFGVAATDPRTVDVAALDGSNGLTIEFAPYPGLPASAAADGLAFADWGANVAALGDVNGDGLADLAIGGSPYLFEYQASFAAVIFGTRDGASAPLALSRLNGVNGFLAAMPRTEIGIATDKFVTGLGDINGDGLADLFAGSRASPFGSYVIYGRRNFAEATTRGTPGDDIVYLTAATPAAYGGAGDDHFYVAPNDFNSSTFTGTGNNTVTFGAGAGGSHAVNGGPGADLYEIGPGLYEVKITDASGAGRGANTLRINFGAGPNFVITRGSLQLDFGPELPQIHLDDIDYADVKAGPRTIDRFEFADGTVLTYAELIARGFDLKGDAGADKLIGTSVTDRISAFAGDDRLVGGRGDDELNGGAGDDVYVINAGDGVDVIVDSVGRDTLEWGGGLTLNGLTHDVDHNDLLLTQDSTTVRVRDWYLGLEQRIERFRFADGVEVDALNWINRAPVAGAALGFAQARAGERFVFSVPATSFSDPDPGDSLQIALSQANGAVLPGWLTFDPNTATLSGTPTAADAGTLALGVIARDPLGAIAKLDLGLTIAAAPVSGPATCGPDHLIRTAAADRIDGRVGLGDGHIGSDQRLLAHDVQALVHAMASFDPRGSATWLPSANLVNALEPTLAAAWHSGV